MMPFHLQRIIQGFTGENDNFYVEISTVSGGLLFSAFNIASAFLPRYIPIPESVSPESHRDFHGFREFSRGKSKNRGRTAAVF